ncbi:hypothetical protein [Streptomyces sp. AB3(2024)]|uniref:hypothetical protein n=1 Tax=Streptomyces sp. AB3(2024) TaxID=3317321 RepID=UPI0035A3CEE4
MPACRKNTVLAAAAAAAAVAVLSLGLTACGGGGGAPKAAEPAAPVVPKAGVPAYANVRVATTGAHEDDEVVTRFNVHLSAAHAPAGCRPPHPKRGPRCSRPAR